MSKKENIIIEFGKALDMIAVSIIIASMATCTALVKKYDYDYKIELEKIKMGIVEGEQSLIKSSEFSTPKKGETGDLPE